MKFGSLFSGIGGLDLGLERAGMECAWQVEIDEYCRKVLGKHWPNVPKYGDIREVGFERVERVDLICGGFPCQPVSIAGKGRAQDDARWLWPEFAKAISLVRPRYVLLENVPGLRHRGLGDVLRDLAALDYYAEGDSLPASAFGAPHQRERFFLVAVSGGEPSAQRSILDSLDDIPRNPQWDTTQNIRTGSGWKRWLIQACEAVDWTSTDRWFHRLDDGLPAQVEQLRGLGNAVVPQVAEWIGWRIMEFDKEIAA